MLASGSLRSLWRNSRLCGNLRHLHHRRNTTVILSQSNNGSLGDRMCTVKKTTGLHYVQSKRLSHSNVTPRVSITNPEATYITHAQSDMTLRYVAMTCSDGKTHDFPFVWLRDNCQCDNCFNLHTLSRSFLMENLDPSVFPHKVEHNQNGDSIDILWNDGHKSQFAVDWLLERSFHQSAQSKRKTWYGVKARHWDSTFQIPSERYEKVLADDRALYDWIYHLGETGLFLLTHVPHDTNALYPLANRVAFLRKTNYGEHFKVETKEDPSNLAFTSLKLGLHTDLPYYRYQPGVQLLHCVEQFRGNGGDNIFADGCHVAELLRKENPKHFDILTRTLVDFVDEGTDYYRFHKLQQNPVILLDHHGNVERIHYNQQVRDSFMTVPVEDVTPFYEAVKHFNDLLYDPQNAVRRKLQSGEIICFNNMRVLHGREGYTVTSSNRRFYMGGYLDWDEMYSRMRVLRKELHIECNAET